MNAESESRRGRIDPLEGAKWAAAGLVWLAAFGLFGDGLRADEPAPVEDRRPLKQVYQEARLAYYARDYAAARTGFEAVLARRPDHDLSQHYLRQIQLIEEEILRNRTLRTEADDLILPEVVVEEMNVDEAVRYLVAKAVETSGGRFKPNVVVAGLDEGSKKRTHTFGLRKVPLSFAFQMLGESAGLSVHYDKFAIRLAPKEQAGNDTSPAGERQKDAAVPP